MKKTNNLVGLDSSCVVRLLIGEPADQAAKAVAALDKLRSEGYRAAVSDLVVSEAYFALQYHYDVPKQYALDQLRQLLSSPEFVALGNALSILDQPNLGKAKPGFVDRLIHAEYLSQTTGMLTFEKSGHKLPAVRLLE